MPFKPGHDPHRNTGGRPRGRVAKFREMAGEQTDDGREIVEGLRAIYNDPTATKTERLKAYELLLAYLLGKPETAVSIEADVTARPAQLDGAALVGRLPMHVIDAVCQELDGDNPPLLPASTDEGGR